MIAELLQTAYLFYPRNVWTSEAFRATPEYQRLTAASHHAAEAYQTWEAMLRRLPFATESHCVQIQAPEWVLPAYAASAYYDLNEPRRRFGFQVSFLGPYYTIVRLGHPLEPPAAAAVTQEIEATYPGHRLVPREIADQFVPDLSPNGEPLGQATVGGCLFGDAYATSCAYNHWGPEIGS